MTMFGFEPMRAEYETTCGVCGFAGKGNGTKPARCPSCHSSW